MSFFVPNHDTKGQHVLSQVMDGMRITFIVPQYGQRLLGLAGMTQSLSVTGPHRGREISINQCIAASIPQDIAQVDIQIFTGGQLLLWVEFSRAQLAASYVMRRIMNIVTFSETGRQKSFGLPRAPMG